MGTCILAVGKLVTGGVTSLPLLTAVRGTYCTVQLVFYAGNQENVALAAWHFYVVHTSTTKAFCGELISS